MKRWELKSWDRKYWYLDYSKEEAGIFIRKRTNLGYSEDRIFIYFGNCFRTRKEAERELAKIRKSK